MRGGLGAFVLREELLSKNSLYTRNSTSQVLADQNVSHFESANVLFEDNAFVRGVGQFIVRSLRHLKISRRC